MKRTTMKMEPKAVEGSGVDIPADLHGTWRQIRTNRATIAALTDALMQRQQQLGTFLGKSTEMLRQNQKTILAKIDDVRTELRKKQ